MKVWQVTRNYFDGDHEHGYYDYGLYTTKETAKETAEIVAKSLTEGNGNWSGSWKWNNKGNCIICEIPGMTYYIGVAEIEVLTTPKENVENTKPVVTFT